MATLDIFRSTVGAAALGFARRALDEAKARAQSRKIYDGKLSDLQIIQSMLGEMALDEDASALIIYRHPQDAKRYVVEDSQKDRETRRREHADLAGALGDLARTWRARLH